MQTHDPRREIEKLREHLASHEKPLAFLIGAGASCAPKGIGDGEPLVPPIGPLGQRCAAAVEAAGASLEKAYDTMASEIAAAPGRGGRKPNIEDILSAVRLKRAALGPGDKLAGADASGLEKIEQTIQSTIATAAVPGEDRIPETLPHHDLARWISRIPRPWPVELFTTNYDTLLERALEDERVPIFDGFVGARDPFFSAATLSHADLAPATRWTRLWKIHGSVTWRWREEPGGGRRIVRGREGTAGELILPSLHKYDESRRQPYLAILDHLHAVLTAREEPVLFCVGYSFGDQHINEVIFDALEARERMHVVALQHTDPSESDELVKRARQLTNLLVYGPGYAVVGGTRGSWRLTEPVDDTLAGLLDVPFDSDAVPDPGAPALTGLFRLGDFIYLAKFLGRIAGTP